MECMWVHPLFFFTFTLTRTPLDIASLSFDYLTWDNHLGQWSFPSPMFPGMDCYISHPSLSPDNCVSRTPTIQFMPFARPFFSIAVLAVSWNGTLGINRGCLQLDVNAMGRIRGAGVAAAAGKFFCFIFIYCFYTTLMNIETVYAYKWRWQDR